jgi:hypothetical protein
MNLEFELGPGTSILGDFIWNPNVGDSDLFKISITGLFGNLMDFLT